MHIYKFHMFLIFPIKGGRLTAAPEDGDSGPDALVKFTVNSPKVKDRSFSSWGRGWFC